ncbi:MAG TPA: HisA/HisF-related TIM barrel protein [Candidatus Deferrimicrobiaceae bacterium]|nr:HisA/HisF-related TIM barrel protein [Candidatus Deferrimicrobiaceae bacterium]
MEPVKIMPCLDMKEGRVVKGIHFVNLRDAGDPVKNAAFYQSEGADELAMLDIAATLENRKTRLEWVKAISAVIDILLAASVFHFRTLSIGQVKNYLKGRGIPVLGI